MSDTTTPAPAPRTRALTGYNVYMQDIGAAWSALSLEEKAVFVGKALASGKKGGYQVFVSEQVALWKPMSEEEKAVYTARAAVIPPRVVKSKKGKVAPVKKVKQSRPPTGWTLFQKAETVTPEEVEEWMAQPQEEGEEKVRAKKGAHMRIKGIRWRALTEEEQGIWKQQAAAVVAVSE